ncbi:MAG: hypothetical protein Q8N51_13770, partial [Gammaproteobacteria bacterium]|nr:hypothetical protein [Gammaproteobacteria bacterium]
LLGKYGATYLPVLLDASGNLYAVFKGDKGAGALVNVKVDVDGQLVIVPRGATGNYLNVDANGYLGAILKAAAEVTIPGGVDVTQTSTLRQVQGKDGVTYRDLKVDASGQIIMVPRGQSGNYLAVDASGFMTTVIKGDYAGALRTVKLDDQGRLSAFVVDTTDQWGKMLNLGNAELAARIVGWPVSYDRRGQVFGCENFDHGWGDFVPHTYLGGSAALHPVQPLQGGYCVKLSTPAVASSYAYIVSMLPAPAPSLTIGLSCFLAMETGFDYLQLLFYYNREPVSYNASIKLTHTDSKIWLYNAAGGWTNIGTYPSETAGNTWWHYLKIVFDLSTLKYKRVIFMGNEMDVSGVEIETSTTEYTACGINIKLVGVASYPAACYVD